MEKPTEIKFFDFHNHPSGKGAISRNPDKYTPWKKIKPWFILFNKDLIPKIECIEIVDLVKELVEESEEPKEPFLFGLRQIFDSQSSLTQLKESGTFSIVALIGIEKAYAQTFFLKTILPAVYPLDPNKLRAVREEDETYYDTFLRDLNQMAVEGKKKVMILKNICEYNKEKHNVVLSIEGAHSLQGKYDDPQSIIKNLYNLKRNQVFRFFHLTLAHLSRQPACTHCYGTKLEKIGIDFTPNFDFRPDPNSKGLTDYGNKIIAEAYDKVPYTILIDIKHMSLLTRKDFYAYRNKNAQWKDIPIVASHAGVTGSSFNFLKARSIVSGTGICSKHDGWVEVNWCDEYSDSVTKFNPWTINLFDEDILEILKSGGLIGLNLDQRILGHGLTYPEAMSPHEIPYLGINIVDQCKKPTENTDHFQDNFNSKMPIPFDFMFQLTPEEMEEEKEFLSCINRRHFDYLACNIIHILKVGLKNEFDGVRKKTNVEDCICIGSDFDGFTDPINFPSKVSDCDNDVKDYVTADEYPRLREEFTDIFTTCLKKDKYMKDIDFNVNGFLEKFFVGNGWNFLNKHFRRLDNSECKPL